MELPDQLKYLFLWFLIQFVLLPTHYKSLYVCLHVCVVYMCFCVVCGVCVWCVCGGVCVCVVCGVYVVCLCVWYLLMSIIYWRHLGCTHVFAIINSAARNIGVHVSFRINIFSEIYSGMKLLDQMVSLWCFFWTTPVACRISRVRDQTHTIAVTTLDP